MVLVGRYTCTPYPMLLDMPILEYIRLSVAEPEGNIEKMRFAKSFKRKAKEGTKKRETIY